MDRVMETLSRDVFRFGDASITVWQLTSVPLLILLILLMARWLARSFTRRMRAKATDENLIQLVNRAFWILVISVIFLASLAILNVPLTALAFLSGAVAIGLGFGAQNIVNNFISGWILMGERPINIGDLVEINDTLGYVETINTRSTRIRRLDGVRIVIPNSYLLENMVVNWTLVDREIRTSVTVGVAYGSPVRKVAELIGQAAREQEAVFDDPEPVVIFQDFGDNALIFEVFFFTLVRPGGDLRRLRSEVRFRIDELFRENDIVIAFPQRDVHLDGAIEVRKADPTA